MPEPMLDSLDTAEFGDRRLTKRFVAVMERLLEKPNMSIPAAMNGRAEMEAAYRFCDNSKVSPDAIRAPHVLATHERIRQTDVVVLVQDTTELDLTRPHQQVDGAGPLDSKSRVGGFYHPLMAFDANGVPLGEVWKKTWVRETIETNLSRDEKRQKRKDTPIEDKESVRWLEGVRAAREVGLRWQIEVYFKTLKSGCRIESRYFERIGRLQNCLAMYTIVAWKILYLCRLSKQCPDLDCEVVFEPCEWKPVYMTVRRKEPPSTPPTLNEMVRMIASLGGYVMRAKTQPGTQTLWLGLQRLHDLSTAWNAFGPGVQRR